MNAIIRDAVGAAAFGIIVGFILRYFLERFEEYNLKNLGKILAIPIGTTVLAFVKNFGGQALSMYAIGLVLGLLLYQACYAKFPSLPMRRSGAAMYSVAEAINALELLDETGQKAIWERRQVMRFNRNSELALIAKVSADGALTVGKLFSHDGRVVKALEVPIAGAKHVYAIFASGVRKGETADVSLIVNFDGSFLGNSESIEHEVEVETAKISFEVRFPKNRPYSAAELVMAFGASVSSLQKAKPGEGALRMAVPGKIKIAEKYRVDW